MQLHSAEQYVYITMIVHMALSSSKARLQSSEDIVSGKSPLGILNM